MRTYPQRICLFLLGLAPFLLLLRWSLFGRNANLAGDLRVVVWFLVVFCGFSALVDCCSYMDTVLCTFLDFTTSTSVRTEPQATSATPEEKKILSRRTSGTSFPLSTLCWYLTRTAACVKKRRAQICLQIQRFINFLQNYAGGRVRQPRTPNTSAARVVEKLIKLNSGSLSCQKGCFIHDSHMLTSDSFFSLQTQHDQSKETQTQQTKQQNKTGREKRKNKAFPLLICLMSS